MSPRSRMPSGRIFFDPPNSRQVMAFLMSAGWGVSGSPWTYRQAASPNDPKILGATLRANRSYSSSLRLSRKNSSSSSGEKLREPGAVASEVSSSRPRMRRYGWRRAGAPDVFFCAAKRQRRAPLSCHRLAHPLARRKRRVDAGRDHAAARDDLAGKVSLGLEEHVPRQLADGDHVGRLLQLDCLLVDKVALVVDDRVRVERALVGLAGGARAAAWA